MYTLYVYILYNTEREWEWYMYTLYVYILYNTGKRMGVVHVYTIYIHPI